MSDFHEGDALSPVLAITSGPLPDVGVVLIRFDVLAHGAEPALEQAHDGTNFMLTPAQARYLVDRIQRSLMRLELAPVLEAAETVH